MPSRVDDDAMPTEGREQRPEVGVAVILAVGLAVLVLSRRLFRDYL